MPTYNLGLIVEHDEPEKARQLFQTAASAGHAKAMGELGSLLKESDPDAARRWFEAAVEAGDPVAMHNFARFLKEKEPARAEQLWRQAAGVGHTAAMYALGLLEKERGNRGQARRYYERAAEQGYVPAMYALGRLLAHEDPATARRYYEQAAAHGDVRAMASLGDMLSSKHPREARQWYGQAAGVDSTYQATRAYALRQLARMYELSWTTSGRPYLEQAAALGDATAMALLATSALRRHHRDEALAWAEKAAAASKEEDFHKLVLTYEERLLRYIGRRGALPFASRVGFECLVSMGKVGSWVLWRSKALWRRVRELSAKHLETGKSVVARRVHKLTWAES